MQDWNAIIYNSSKVNFCSHGLSNHTIWNDSYLTNADYLNISLQLNLFINLPLNQHTSFVNRLESSFNSSILGYTGKQIQFKFATSILCVICFLFMHMIYNVFDAFLHFFQNFIVYYIIFSCYL